MKNEIQKRSDLPVSSRTELAMHLHNQVMLGIFVTAMAVRRIHDEKLYEELGCKNFNEYVDTMAGISRSQAFICIRIAKRFQLVEKDGKVQTSGLLPDSTDIESLGWTKLDVLASLNDEDFKEIMSGGEISTVDGKTYTYKDMLEMGARELKEELVELRRKSNKEIQRLKEDVKLAQAEKEAAEAMNLEVEKRLKLAKELEKKYGEVAWKLEDKRNVLEKAKELLYDSEIFFFKLNLTEEDPQSLIEDVLKFVQYVDGYHKKMMTHFAFLLDVIEA